MTIPPLRHHFLVFLDVSLFLSVPRLKPCGSSDVGLKGSMYNHLPTPTHTVIHTGVMLPAALEVPTGSPSLDGDVAVYAFDINQLSLPTPLYSVLVPISLFMALSTVFHQ